MARSINRAPLEIGLGSHRATIPAVAIISATCIGARIRVPSEIAGRTVTREAMTKPT
jgi:hypothetical protein